MDIKCLDPLGINGFERKANEVLAESLPASWKGYSSLEMLGRQGRDFEADLILITHDRIIVVELKNYRGKIFANGNKWVQEYEDGRQENRINAVSQASRAAKILKSRLQQKLQGKYVPYVDKCVVLCGSVDASSLPEEDRECVHTLDEFKNIGNDAVYAKLIGRPIPSPRKEDAPNKNITVWDRIFLNNSADFKPKTFSSNNYVLNGQSLFQHKEGLYSEYQSQRVDNANYKALMRRWDFTAPCIVEHARTPDQRVVIAQRESNVLGYIDNQNEDLKDSHLQLLHIPNDLTEDFVELYEWPNKKERLDTFIRKNSAKLTDQNRLDLLQMLISQLSRLHDIQVAHRDLGSHSIWVSLPSKVVLSNFLTAYYPDPEKKSVSHVRKIIQHGRVETPEEFLEENSHATVYTRDVYLATAACHFIAFDKWPKKDDGVYVWSPIPNNPISEKLSAWFSRGLELDSRDRFQDLSASLTELNKLLNLGSGDPSANLSLLAKYHSKVNVFSDFGAVFVRSEGTFHLLKAPDESFAVKAWFGVSDTNKNGGINHQLLLFFSRLENIKNASLSSLPKIMEFGLNPTMTSAYFKYEWVAGQTWDDAVIGIEKSDALQLAKKLISAVLKLHAAKLNHGDLHPNNLIVIEGNVRFIDLVEYDLNEVNKHTIAYVPASYETMSKVAIDRYATVKVINELAASINLIHLSKYTCDLLELPEISTNELEKLLDNFDEIVSPPPPVTVEKYEIFHKNFNAKAEQLVSDDGTYYLTLTPNAGKERDLLEVNLNGTRKHVKLLINLEKKFVVGVTNKEIRHDQFIWNKRDSQLKLSGQIILSNDIRGSTEKFIDYILASDAYKTSVKEPEASISESKFDGRILTLPKMEKSSVVDAREIWKILVETEEESYPRIQIATEPQYLENKLLSFRFTVDGSKFDFNLTTERVNVKMYVRGDFKLIGAVEDMFSDTIIVRPRLNVTPQVGDTIVLESSMSASSLSKREKAITKIITGRAVIPNLPDFFSPGLVVEFIESGSPTEEELDAYTEYDDAGSIIFALNKQQREAFKALYKFGPVALLQGPPGTGKTAFIGSYIHYSIMNGARRVLLVSQSHEAVNNASERVRALFKRNGQNFEPMTSASGGCVYIEAYT